MVKMMIFFSWQPLAASNVEGAVEPGASLTKAVQRKLRDTEEACRLEGLEFLPFAVETLGGFHAGAVVQVKQIAAALARSKGSQESEAISQLFGKLSLTLQRCNAMMLSSRQQDGDFVPPEIDGILWFFDISIVQTFRNTRFHTLHF